MYMYIVVQPPSCQLYQSVLDSLESTFTSNISKRVPTWFPYLIHEHIAMVHAPFQMFKSAPVCISQVYTLFDRNLFWQIAFGRFYFGS